MTVRAKFSVSKVECSHTTKGYHKGADGKDDYKKPILVEMRTIHMNPVYANNDPKHENSKFWDASPSGGLTLGTINPAAWQYFQLGKEYYLDFTESAQEP